MQRPVILSFNLGPERSARVRTLCLVQKLGFMEIPPERQGASVGALAGILPGGASDAFFIPFSDEMLVLCGLSEEALNAFLHGFRMSGLAPVALKAVLTPSNAPWSAARLHAELSREHEAFRGWAR